MRFANLGGLAEGAGNGRFLEHRGLNRGEAWVLCAALEFGNADEIGKGVRRDYWGGF